MSAMFDCVADGLLVFDEGKKIVLALIAAVEMAGYDPENLSREELHRRYSLFEIDTRTPIPIEREPLEVALAEKTTSALECFVKSNDGLARDLRAQAVPFSMLMEL